MYKHNLLYKNDLSWPLIKMMNCNFLMKQFYLSFLWKSLKKNLSVEKIIFLNHSAIYLYTQFIFLLNKIMLFWALNNLKYSFIIKSIILSLSWVSPDVLPIGADGVVIQGKHLWQWMYLYPEFPRQIRLPSVPDLGSYLSFLLCE